MNETFRVSFGGGVVVVPVEKIRAAAEAAVAEALKAVEEMATTAKISYVTLSADKWSGSGNLYSQVVAVEGVTENSQVDLTPSVEQLAIFYDKDLAFVTENDNGVVTVYAIGQKPQNDYTIQATVLEVNR